MRQAVLSIAMLAFLGVSSYAAPKARTFRGEIMDSACAAMGSHDAGYKMTHTHTPKDCTLACVKAGSTFVLYNPATKTTYKLDNQQKPRIYAGQNVKVIGTYAPGSRTIHVERIEPGS